MKMMLQLVATSAAFAALSANVASAEPVTVFNSGQDTSGCAFMAYGGWYTSVSSTVVLNDDGTLKLMRCSAELVKGSPVDSTIEYWNGDLHVVISPGGHANISLHP
jgi:hypothetical protein